VRQRNVRQGPHRPRSLGERGHYRVYGKSMYTENTIRANGEAAVDEWRRHQMGFRGDWSGAGYRRSSDRIEPGLAARFIPESRDPWWNVFVQDRVALGDKVELTLGLKLESNDYPGTESLPSMRVAFRPAAQRLLWGAWSRAVRAPSRFDRDVFFPGTPPHIVQGGPDFQSEGGRCRRNRLDDLAFVLLLRNLLDDEHPEFGPPPVHSEIPRSAMLDVSWRFGR